MSVLTGVKKPEIIERAEVVIDTDQTDLDVADRAHQYHEAYKHLYPFRVVRRTDSRVVLEDPNGEIVHFGSGACAEFAIGYVKLSV